jgi:predicted nucleotidyltransferase
MLKRMDHSAQTQWRLAFAQEIGVELRKYSGVRAIIVGGSVARGYADEYSDLEIPLFWNTLPTDETRLAIAADLGAGFLYPFSGPALEDNLLIHGFQVDLWHITVSGAEQVIESVLQEFSLDPGDSNFMDTIRFCIPLYGEALIEAWKQKVRIYPDELAASQIQQAMNAVQATHLSILAHRDNPTLLYGQISDLQEQVFLILLALNRHYFPAFKWMYPILSEMVVKPEGIAARFRRVYSCSADQAAEDTARIVDETLRLVQEQFPQLDPQPVWNQLKMTRTAHVRPIRFNSGSLPLNPQSLVHNS